MEKSGDAGTDYPPKGSSLPTTDTRAVSYPLGRCAKHDPPTPLEPLQLTSSMRCWTRRVTRKLAKVELRRPVRGSSLPCGPEPGRSGIQPAEPGTRDPCAVRLGDSRLWHGCGSRPDGSQKRDPCGRRPDGKLLTCERPPAAQGSDAEWRTPPERLRAAEQHTPRASSQAVCRPRVQRGADSSPRP